MPPRPSPAKSATAYPAGTKRRGGDGNVWAVTVTARGVHRWTLVTRKWHKILFTEPYTYSADKKPQGVEFKVSNSFYGKLLNAPRKFFNNNGNAYVFGVKRPLREYTYAGYHHNDGAQTGFIDVDQLSRMSKEVVSEIVLAIYMGERFYNWDNRFRLRKLRAVIPHILFMGGTVGGDVGATLHVHATRGKIDGLIIDNNYFFERG